MLPLAEALDRRPVPDRRRPNEPSSTHEMGRGHASRDRGGVRAGPLRADDLEHRWLPAMIGDVSGRHLGPGSGERGRQTVRTWSSTTSSGPAAGVVADELGSSVRFQDVGQWAPDRLDARRRPRPCPASRHHRRTQGHDQGRHLRLGERPERVGHRDHRADREKHDVSLSVTGLGPACTCTTSAESEVTRPAPSPHFDTNGDGRVDLREGLPAYGPVA